MVITLLILQNGPMNYGLPVKDFSPNCVICWFFLWFFMKVVVFCFLLGSYILSCMTYPENSSSH